jgi:hypothetical protein
MGAWGPGNFDNDAALDLLTDAVAVATSEIEAFCGSDRCSVEDIDAIMACVEVHLALQRGCGAAGADLALARVLRAKALRLYDGGIDDLKPTPHYRRARREVLARTLARYERAARAPQRRAAPNRTARRRREADDA